MEWTALNLETVTKHALPFNLRLVRPLSFSFPLIPPPPLPCGSKHASSRTLGPNGTAKACFLLWTWGHTWVFGGP
eukprot:2913776-Rhodomonas_salina.1